MNSSEDDISGKWHWVETDWMVADLQDQSVAFRAIDEGGKKIVGEGIFDVIDRPKIDSLKRVEIVISRLEYPDSTITRFFLPQGAVNKIRKNKNSTFSLFLW